MSGSCLVNSGDERIAAGEPALPSCDNLGRFEVGSSKADDCLRFAPWDFGDSVSTGRITAEDIGLGKLSAGELTMVDFDLPHTLRHFITS